MALSDYLTGDEWDACFYKWCGSGDNLGESMNKTVAALLSRGYRFSGLTETGEKLQQVSDGVNAPKMLFFIGNPKRVDPLGLLENGRRFLKVHAPDLIEETDEEWAVQMTEAQKA